VPPGIRLTPPAEAAAASIAVRALAGSDGPVIVLVGRLDRAKGHLDVVSAARRLVARHEGFRVLFLGADEPSQPRFGDELRVALEQAGMAGRVLLLGHRDDAQDILAGSDVVVVASQSSGRHRMGQEGFGLVAVEAMAVGTPVVAYASGAVPEVLGECGVLVPPRDVAGLAEGIDRVLTDERLRARLAECGRRRAREYSLEAAATLMTAHYREVSAASTAACRAGRSAL
jgi:glycosyltransferase involved in cell wall biosynthesis